MSTTDEDVWMARLHGAVDHHPSSVAFDTTAYVAAGRRRLRRKRLAAVAAAVAASVAAALATTVVLGDGDGKALPSAPDVPDLPRLVTSTDGWVAFSVSEGGGDIYLVRPGTEPRRLAVNASDTSTEACPSWAPDGTRLIFGQVLGAANRPRLPARLVLVPVAQDGVAGSPTTIPLDGFRTGPGFDPHPCATWAPDGRWVALRDQDEVWVLDTLTRAIRRLPDLRPSDMEWRPGTDELTVTGDIGVDRASPTRSTPIATYSVSTGELQQLGSARAAAIAWSPDGRTLAYEGGEGEPRQIRVVDADGGNDRVLVADAGQANHGIGPVWSPRGDRIAYQRLLPTPGELHEVVLVGATDGSETVIAPPRTDLRIWHPFSVSWSPDGAALLYVAWGVGGGPNDPGGVVDAVITVEADSPHTARVLTPSTLDPVGGTYGHPWSAVQVWGRQS
ncbi:hypothetical protein N798_13245 [Knoellia flava TL1]|uniref:Lipoprotein LpqB beta-propeller domain-containing protein n=2 Tax=Knoellia flava TaxID=913969 RepID=A0A8H9FSM1_9MICO|nr:PD40 domain-containing protein [Knoellia flava]KGN29614.1 hypothetical protein N798_13245 [Knoellia flava TL1]GGB75974.1 hypothetical protein GCM10011314_14420 [Knoellia flava]